MKKEVLGDRAAEKLVELCQKYADETASQQVALDPKKFAKLKTKYEAGEKLREIAEELDISSLL